MRVEGLTTRCVTMATDGPEADGTLDWDHTTMVVAVVEAGGHTGVGWTYAPSACATVIEDVLGPAVVGTDAHDVPGIHEAMSRSVRNAGRAGVAACAISAVDVALWDLKARIVDVPVWALLGRCRTRVPVYGSGGFTSYDDARLTEQLDGWVAQGIARMKIKIGGRHIRSVDHELARIRLARRAIGPRRELFVDANGAYTPAQAIELMNACADADVRWFEEPVTSDDLEGLRRVRDAVSADVAAGEYAWTLDDVVDLCAAGAVDCLQLHATRCGGYTGWLRAAAVAQAYHLDVSAHGAPQLHAPVAAAVPNLRHIEWFHDHVRLEEQVFSGFREARGGVLVVGDERPGHGLSLRERG